MKKKSIAQSLISIFLGASWAIVILFVVISYKILSTHPTIITIGGMIIAIMLALLLILIFEVIALQFDKYDEILKQTSLLEDIKKSLDSVNSISNN
jgi:type VI protein secretion system component VasK